MRCAAIICVLVACRDAPPDAPCAISANRFFIIVRDDLARSTVDDATRRAVTERLPALRDELYRACTDDAWSASVRNCIANAPDHIAIERCESELTETQRRGLDRAARGE